MVCFCCCGHCSHVNIYGGLYIVMHIWGGVDTDCLFPALFFLRPNKKKTGRELFPNVRKRAEKKTVTIFFSVCHFRILFRTRHTTRIILYLRKLEHLGHTRSNSRTNRNFFFLVLSKKKISKKKVYTIPERYGDTC